jgi:hypothetical protein
MRTVILVVLCVIAAPAAAEPPPCNSGTVFEDRNANGHRDGAEPGVAGVKVSDGVSIVVTDARGNYALPAVDGRSRFVIKPAGYSFLPRANGLPDYWRNVRTAPGPTLKYGGIPVAAPLCGDFGDFALARRGRARKPGLSVLVFADPQPKSMTDVDYYRRDIVQSVLQPEADDGVHRDDAGRSGRAADLGLSLGDIVHDDLSLYAAVNAATAEIGVPWLHVPGNHDLDFDAARDEDSLLTFRHVYGPDTFAWEEPEAAFVLLDDVVYRPGQSPAYIGGLREEQFAFLERYLPTLPPGRLLVVGLHIPLFDAAPGRETFRHADRARLFALLRDFPRALVLSGHSHAQRHVLHDAASDWRGREPLHEYSVGAACGAFWSGTKDAAGIPDATMSDGTPNGYARLRIGASGEYALSWHPARPDRTSSASTSAIRLHAPKVLRHGAYPAAAVYANVFMGRDDSRVEYRVDGGGWMPMQHVAQPDPRLQVENVRDDSAETLRGYDRAPEATPSTHLWRGILPTDRSTGEHRIDVRAFDAWQGEQRALTRYRLEGAAP